MTVKPELKKLINDLPDYVPRFGEMGKVNYNFKGISWKKIYKKVNMNESNIFRILGLYDIKIR